jgi:PAS domain S-box-containing protein
MKELEDGHPTMIDAIPTMAWSSRPDGFIEFVNQRWLDYTGFSRDEAVGWGCNAAFHPDDRGPLADKWCALVTSGQPGEIEARMRRRDGEYRWFLLRAEPVRDQHGWIIKWYGVNIDIEDRKRAESLLAAEKRTLEMIAGGAPLADILNALCDTIDAQSSGIISTAMLMDPNGKRLWPIAGRRVPKDWIGAITPVEIGPCVGSCGTAAYRSQRVITSDIAVDPLWIDYRELALGHEIK